MSDLKARLQLAASGVRPAPDAMERSKERAARRGRRRRASTAMTAIALSSLAVLFAVRTLSPLAPPGPADRSAASVPALWPEHGEVALRAAQHATEAGGEEPAWRLNPREVAVRFVANVMGWRSVEASAPEQWTPDDEIPRARVRICSAAGCPPVGASFDAQVTLAQLAARGPDGVWSVVAVESGQLMLDPLDLGLPPLTNVEAGMGLDPFTSSVKLGGLAEGTQVVGGSVYWGACGPVREAETHTVWFRYIHFRVATTPDTTCDGQAVASTFGPLPSRTPGFVFALWPPDATNRVLSALSGSGPTRDGDVVAGLSAIAVEFQPAQIGPPLPDFDRDPSSLPECRPEELIVGRPTSTGEAVPPQPYGVGISIVVRQAPTSGPCRAALRISIDIVNGEGDVIPVDGDHTNQVDGPLPSYVPDVRNLQASWRLGNWCPAPSDGPHSVRMTVDDGRSWDTPVPALDRFCSGQVSSPPTLYSFDA
jgi:hypothetical protein